MKYTTPNFPNRVEIELVSDCNLRCIYCPRHFVNDLHGYMDFDLFSKIISEVSTYPESILVLHRRGESMLHPRFCDMLDLVAGKFAEVQMATNGTVLHRGKFQHIVNALDFLSFSLDAPATYNKVRVGANYEKVSSNVLSFLEFNKGKVKTQASMVKTASTRPEDSEAFALFWENKVDRVRIYEAHSVDGKFGSLSNPRPDRQPCVMPIYELLVYENGKVARCNHDWDGKPMGDLCVQSIFEVWHSDQYKNLRQQHKMLEISDPVCSECDSWYPEIGVQGTGEVIEK